MPDHPLRVLLVDDEPLARLRLRSLLSDVGPPVLQLVGEAGSGTEALHLLAREPVDVLLLDIHMPGLDGLGLARRLRSQAQPPAVIFVTAHAEHALSAFELDAVDYLTKPVRRERLHEALLRAQARLGRQPAAPAEEGGEHPVLVVSDRGRVLRIPVIDVVYLKAEMKYVTLVTRQHRYVLDDALADLEQRLGDVVLRTHRSVLVARAAVRALERRVWPAGEGQEADEAGEGWAVQVAPGGEWLPVSRRQVAAVREALAQGGA
jgi:two-component system, LytTR family, response regulator AlgR